MRQARISFMPVLVVAALASFAPNGHAELTPEWVAGVPVGSALSAGIGDSVVDANGVTFVTGVEGPSFNTDVVTAAFGSDGEVLWERSFDGPSGGSDQAHAIELGAGDTIWVAGNTPGANNFADVLLLQYDAVTGALLRTVQYTSGFGISESGRFLTVDSRGDVYVAGSTVGDGGDALLVKFDSQGQFVWRRTWDGPAFGPFSQDSVQDLALDPNGDLLVLINGIMGAQQPDYVVVKYRPADGTTLWENNWSTNAGESPNDLEVDASGDVYVTGTALEVLTDRFGTVKLSGVDGHLVWEAYDGVGLDDSGFALALDGQGGVYITGAVDPDGDQSNFNENIHVVKRDASTGAFQWSFTFGANCVGCFDSPSDVVADPFGNVFVSGVTSSPPLVNSVITFVLDSASGSEVERGVLAGPDPGAGAGELALDGQFALLNAGQTTNPNTGQKTISVFKYPSAEGTAPTTYCTAKVSSAGCVATLTTSAAGQPVSGANDYSVVANSVQGQKNGILFGGFNGPANVPFGGGTLCVQPPLRRGPVTTSGGTGAASCDGSLATTVNDGLILPVGLDAGTGSSGWYQAWYRNPMNGAGDLGTALSNAVQLDFQ